MFGLEKNLSAKEKWMLILTPDLKTHRFFGKRQPSPWVVQPIGRQLLGVVVHFYL